MPTVDTDIEVDAPIERVYRFWSDFERFPSFMENVKEVRRKGADETHWVVEVAGSTLEWDARTTTQENREIAWTATGEAGQSGRVTFDPVAEGRTRVHVHIDYHLPDRFREWTAETFHLDERAIREDLKNFRDQVE